MYNVSDAYKLAVADRHRKSKIRAVLSTDSAVINLDDNDIIKDTVYITNQCTNGNEWLRLFSRVRNNDKKQC